MTINELLVHNFQKHHKLKIDFDKGITTIVGESDVGKSAVVRAMRWASFNHPAGMAFIRNGAKGCTVTLKTDEHTVRRKRSKKINQYILDDVEYSAIRQGEVPEKVEDALRLTDLNFQLQHDAPLWLSDGAAQVARELNKIVDLDLIDNVQKRINQNGRKLASDVSACTERIDKAQHRLDETTWVADADRDFKVIEARDKEITRMVAMERQLDELIEQVEHHDAKVMALKDAEYAFYDIEKIEDVSDKIIDLGRNARGLAELGKRIQAREVASAALLEELQPLQDQLDSIASCPTCGQPVLNE